MSRKTGGLKLMQELNHNIILELIRKEGPLSRSDIAKKANLSPTTVTSAINSFLMEELVEEGGQGVSKGGRRPILVNFRPDSKYVIGVAVSNTSIMIGKLNLNAEVITKQTHVIDIYKERKQVVPLMLDLLSEVISTYNDLDNCIGISIIVPGIVDANKGIIRYNAKLDLTNIEFKKIVEERVGITTFIENDANSIVMAEKQFGRFQDASNILYVQLGDGLGCGLIINNKIYRGSHGATGEFGHITVDRGGMKCECGNSGCLENYVSWHSIYSRIFTAIQKGANTKMLEYVSDDVMSIKPKHLIDAFMESDPLAESIIEETMSYLATGIASLVNLFDPEIILIGGDVVQNNEKIISILNEKVKNSVFDYLASDLSIMSSSLGDDFKLIGSASVLLQDIFHFSI